MLGTSLVVPSNAGGEGSIPGQGAKIPHASQPKKPKHKTAAVLQQVQWRFFKWSTLKKKKPEKKSIKSMILIQFILAFNYYISHFKMFFN